MTDPKTKQSAEDSKGIGAEAAEDEDDIAVPLPIEENDGNAQPG